MTLLQKLKIIYFHNKVLNVFGLIFATIPLIFRIIFPYLSFLMIFLSLIGFCCVFYVLILLGEKSAKKLLKYLSKTIKYLFLSFTLFFLLSNIFIQHKIISSFNQKEKYCNYIIVLGAGINGDQPTLILKNRLDKATEYLNKNKNCTAVLCGGKGKGETLSEAYVMKKYLLSQGISDSRIILEDRSTDTNENIAFAKKLISQTDNIAVCTNDFHLYRSKLIMKKYGFTNVVGISAKVPSLPFMRLNYHLREYFSIILEYMEL